MVLEMNVLNGIFKKTEIFQPKYHWVDLKYLGAIENQRQQFFCRHGNAFPQYTSAFALTIAACQC